MSIFKTGKGCPIFQLNLESGHLPARLAIKRMKLIFFRYILSQQEHSLICKFLMAQYENPKPGDWYSEVKLIVNKFEFNISDEIIKNMQENVFKNIVKKNTCVAGLKYLKMKQSKVEKASNIIYETVELQDYLKSCSKLKLEEQRFSFSFRSRMNELKVISQEM